MIGYVSQRDERSGLLVVDVAANAPFDAVDRRIRAIPSPLRAGRWQSDGVTVRAARRIGLVESADRVMKIGDCEKSVVWRPPVVKAVSPHTWKSAASELVDLGVREHVPLVHDDGIVLLIVRAGTGAGIQEWD